MRVELRHRFEVALEDGFDYIVDPRNWPNYWPGLISVEPGSRWRAPGDRARVVMRLLGRTVELEMTLRTFDPYLLVEYDSRQRAFPDVRHERGFSAEGDGFAYRLGVVFEPRAGLRGLADRVLLPRAIERAMRRTVANLDRAFLRTASIRARCPSPGSSRIASGPCA
jgi:Polyketide cyclase / dehydrase and lipid transport